MLHDGGLKNITYYYYDIQIKLSSLLIYSNYIHTMEYTASSIILSVLLISHGCSQECDSGWTRFSDSCYRSFEDTKTRQESLELCNDLQSHLVSFASQEEFDFCLDLVKNYDFWIGLSRRLMPQSVNLTERRKGWLWEDGSAVTWTNWFSSEPNYDDTKVMVSRSSGDTWFGKDNSYPLYLKRICEKSLFNETDKGVRRDYNEPPEGATQNPELMTSSDITQESVTEGANPLTGGGNGGKKKSDLKTIVGASAVSATVVIVIAVFSCILCRNQKKKSKPTEENPPPQVTEDSEDPYYSTVNEANMDDPNKRSDGGTYTGLIVNGLSTIGLPSNGLSGNGLSSNGLSGNGLDCNGFSVDENKVSDDKYRYDEPEPYMRPVN